MAVASPDYVAGRVWKPIGYGRWATQLTVVTNLDDANTAGKRLRDFAGTKSKPVRALIQAETQAIRWTDDPDVDPAAATNGMIIAAGQTLEYDGDLSKIRFIQAAATAVMHVSFYAQ